MKKQGLIAVDLDGTLFDTVAVNAESYRRALESFGFTLDYDYYAAYCNGRHYRAFLQPLMGGNPSAEDVERVHDLKKQYYAANMDIARKNEALFVILEALRPTHYLAVITTGSRQNATEMLDHFHCTDWFDLILTQEDVVNNKPDPEGYLKEHPDANIKIAALTNDASQVAFPVRKGDETATLREALNQAINELREDGTIAEISEKYFGTDLSQAPSAN